MMFFLIFSTNKTLKIHHPQIVGFKNDGTSLSGMLWQILVMKILLNKRTSDQYNFQPIASHK
jgi:hypothetical protein